MGTDDRHAIRPSPDGPERRRRRFMPSEPHRLEPSDRPHADASGADANTYELTPQPPAPELPGQTFVGTDVHELFDDLGTDLLMQALACTRRFGSFHLAMGDAPLVDRLRTLLLIDPKLRSLPWRLAHIWLADEVVAPAGASAAFGRDAGPAGSHARQILDTLRVHAGVPTEQIHRVDTNDSDPALAYERTLRDNLQWRERGHDRLDFVVLQLFEDGSVAGLNPGFVAPPERLYITDPASGRATMTPSMLNASRAIAVLASGAAVRPVVKLLASGEAPADMPATWLNPLGGVLRWYVDQDANPLAPGA